MKNYKKNASLRKFMVHRKFAKKGIVYPKISKARRLLYSESRLLEKNRFLMCIQFISMLLNSLSKEFLTKTIILSQIATVDAEYVTYCYFSTLAGGKYALQSSFYILNCPKFDNDLLLCNATKQSPGVISKWVTDICQDAKIMALNESLIFNISLDMDLQCVVASWCSPHYLFSTRESLGILLGVCLCLYSCKKVLDGGCKIAASNLGRYICGNRQRFYPLNNQVVHREQKRSTAANDWRNEP